MARLGAAVADGRAFLVGGAFTLADVRYPGFQEGGGSGCFVRTLWRLIPSSPSHPGFDLQVVVYCTLLPLRGSPSPSGGLAINTAVSKYLDGIAALGAVKKAEAEVIGGDLGAVAELFRADGRDYAAAQPKLPVPGQRNILVRFEILFDTSCHIGISKSGHLSMTKGQSIWAPRSSAPRLLLVLLLFPPSSSIPLHTPDHQCTPLCQQRPSPRKHHRMCAQRRLLRQVLQGQGVQHGLRLRYGRVRDSHRDQGVQYCGVTVVWMGWELVK